MEREQIFLGTETVTKVSISMENLRALVSISGVTGAFTSAGSLME